MNTIDLTGARVTRVENAPLTGEHERERTPLPQSTIEANHKRVRAGMKNTLVTEWVDPNTGQTMRSFTHDIVVRDENGDALDAIRSSMSVDRGVGTRDSLDLLREEQGERTPEAKTSTPVERDENGRFKSRAA